MEKLSFALLFVFFLVSGSVFIVTSANPGLVVKIIGYFLVFVVSPAVIVFSDPTTPSKT